MVNNSAGFPPDLVSVVPLGVVAGGDHDPGRGTLLEDSEGHVRGWHRGGEHVDWYTRPQDRGRYLRQNECSWIDQIRRLSRSRLPKMAIDDSVYLKNK